MYFRQERRVVQRTRLREGALVIIPGLRGVSSCLLRDLSSKGASLQLHEIALVPTEFSISLDGLRQIFGCRLIWRRGDLVGIEFKRQ